MIRKKTQAKRLPTKQGSGLRAKKQKTKCKTKYKPKIKVEIRTE